MQQVSRRRALGLGAAALAMARVPKIGGHERTDPDASTPSARSGPDPPGTDPFQLGVTSGDPDATSVVLWTRLTGPHRQPLDGDDVEVTWELATDAAFDPATVTASGPVTARADEAHSVHVVVALEGPAWFRFRVGDRTSPVGRTAPVPADPTRLTIAAASCQHWEYGYYAAHRDIAGWQPDLVTFLGDFIYEYAASTGGVRSHDGPEVRTLDEYRARYGLYLSDADLQSSRAAAPWLAIWDDHEVENNYAGLTPEDPAETGDFPARRLAAYQAWWEHMPVRIERPAEGADVMISRVIDWGPLARIVALDGRQFRSDQACGDAVLDLDPACAEAADPTRTMLGTTQERWLSDTLAEVPQRWAVIAQQTVVSDLRLPNGAIINHDQWDGYAPARDRLLVAAAQTERAVVLTGDIHLAIAGRLPGVGAEFVSTSVSSPGPALPASLAAGVSGLFPNIAGAEFDHRGYVRHTVTADDWTAEFRSVADAADPTSAVTTWRTFGVDAAAPDVVVER